ncbi:Platelet-activating factor acetylhydrolase IB subunit beta, partial [Frankliniella fusca]
MNPCLVPKPAQSRSGDDRWIHIHNRFLSETKEREPDVVILGDNITSQLEQRSIWKEVFAPMHILNFSIIGDQIQNVMWRVQNGELDNIKPKVVVLYVGEINIRSLNKPEEAIEGLLELIKVTKEKQPEAQILVQVGSNYYITNSRLMSEEVAITIVPDDRLRQPTDLRMVADILTPSVHIPCIILLKYPFSLQELLPRGLNPNPLRDSIEKFNTLLKESMTDEQTFKVVPVGEGIVKADGTISHVDLVDWYYPSNDGYLKAFGPLVIELKTILQNSG